MDETRSRRRQGSMHLLRRGRAAVPAVSSEPARRCFRSAGPRQERFGLRAVVARLVPSCSDEGVDSGGCSAGRATAPGACWSPRIGPPASTQRLPFAGGRGRSACHLLTSPLSAWGADSPAFVCEQVRAAGLPVPRVWRRAAAPRRAGQDPIRARWHGWPVRLRDRVCPTPVALRRPISRGRTAPFVAEQRRSR